MAGTRLPHRTCNQSDSWQEPFGIRRRALSLLQQMRTDPTCEHPIPADPTRAITLATNYSDLLMTIRVMAWPERSYLTAHAAKATPGKSPSVSDSELCAASANSLPSKLASIQFRGTSPMPPHTTTQGWAILPCLSPIMSLQNSNSKQHYSNACIRMKESIPNRFHYSGPMLNIP